MVMKPSARLRTDSAASVPTKARPQLTSEGRVFHYQGVGGVVGRGREGRRKKELEMPWPNGPWDRSGQSHVDPVLPMGCRA